MAYKNFKFTVPGEQLHTQPTKISTVIEVVYHTIKAQQKVLTFIHEYTIPGGLFPLLKSPIHIDLLITAEARRQAVIFWEQNYKSQKQALNG